MYTYPYVNNGYNNAYGYGGTIWAIVLIIVILFIIWFCCNPMYKK